jgi:hypothetical protein
VIVIAVDPGKVTGFFTYDSAAPVDAGSGDELPMWEFVDWMQQRALFGEWLGSEVQVVCESFSITKRSMTQRGERAWSIEQIGILQYMVRMRGSYVPMRPPCHYAEQSPSDAKGFSTDAKLKRVGWWLPGQEHARDAARHALLWATRQGHVRPAALMEA